MTFCSGFFNVSISSEYTVNKTRNEAWNISNILYVQLTIHLDSGISWKQEEFELRLLLQKISSFGVNSLDAGSAVSCINFISMAWISQAWDMIINTRNVSNAKIFLIISFVKYEIPSLIPLQILLFLLDFRKLIYAQHKNSDDSPE